MIKSKKILYFGPKFFGYEVEIQKTLKSLGGEVDFYDERPKNSFLIRVLIAKFNCKKNSKREHFKLIPRRT